MAQLTNVVTEQFPFLVTPSGLGIERSIMLQFLHLCTKGTLLCTFCNSLNDTLKNNYNSTHAQYLDRLPDKAKGVAAHNALNQVVLKPVYPHKSVGH